MARAKPNSSPRSGTHCAIADIGGGRDAIVGPKPASMVKMYRLRSLAAVAAAAIVIAGCGSDGSETDDGPSEIDLLTEIRDSLKNR